MREHPQRPDPAADQKPQKQTGEQYGSIKSAQQRNPERADVARGSEPETRAAGGGRRG